MNKEATQQLFTVTVFSENCVGLLNQVSIIFTRRGLNIEDVSASTTSKHGIHRLTISLWSDRETMDKVVKQIEKRVDVLKVFLYTDDDIISQEVALYKVESRVLIEKCVIEGIITRHNARILDVTPDYIVIEKTGHPLETEALLEELRPYGIKQFVRSGRVCVTKTPVEKLDLYLEEQQLRQQRILGHGE